MVAYRFITDIMYYFNDATLNIQCHGDHPISTMTRRVSEECQSGVQIRGCRVWRGLWVTFGRGRSLRAAFGRSIGQGVGVEGACSSIGDCWKGLRIGSTAKHLWNLKVVGVQRMLKVSEVGIGKTPRQLWSGNQVIPWQSYGESSLDKWPFIDSNKSKAYPGIIPIIKYWGKTNTIPLDLILKLEMKDHGGMCRGGGYSWHSKLCLIIFSPSFIIIN